MINNMPHIDRQSVYWSDMECVFQWVRMWITSDYLWCTKRIHLYCTISALLQHKQIICGAQREYVCSVCYAHYYSTNRKPLVHKENPFVLYGMHNTTVQTENLCCTKRIDFYSVLKYTKNGGKTQKIALKYVELTSTMCEPLIHKA